MAINGNCEYTTGQTFSNNGTTYTVVSCPIGSDYITVQDEAGNIIRRKKDEAILSFYQERKDEQSALIEKYQDLAQQYDNEKSEWHEKIKYFFKQMNLLGKDNEQYAELKNQYWDARFKAVAAGNRAFSCSIQAFIEATNTNWA